jgi:hypothetical protein
VAKKEEEIRERQEAEEKRRQEEEEKLIKMLRERMEGKTIVSSQQEQIDGWTAFVEEEELPIVFLE